MRRFLVFLSVILCFLLVGSVLCFADTSAVDLTQELSVSEYVSLVDAGTIPELVIADPILIYQLIYDGQDFVDVAVGDVVRVRSSTDSSLVLSDVNTDPNKSTVGLTKSFPANTLAFSDEAGSETGFSIDSVLSVFKALGSWIVSVISTLIGLFWVDGSLTLVGTLSVCGLAISIIFLIILLVRRFFNFAG